MKYDPVLAKQIFENGHRIMMKHSNRIQGLLTGLGEKYYSTSNGHRLSNWPSWTPEAKNDIQTSSSIPR